MGYAAKTIRFDISSSSAPAWWTALADGQWAAVANTSGKRLSDVVPVPNPIVPILGGAVRDLTSDWNGLAVNQDTAELMCVSHGGHSSWAGNEAYVLNLRATTPGWVRITDPTPVVPPSPWVPTNIDNDNGWNGTFGKGLWNDGRPTATHCSGECYGNGRVWFPIANSFSNRAGDGTNLFYTFNLNYPALLTARASGTPLAWTSSNIGPWEVWGTIKNPNGSDFDEGLAGKWTFGSSIFDPVTKDIWYFTGKGDFDPGAFQFHTTSTISYPSTVPSYKIWPTFSRSTNGGAGRFGTWTACAYDLRIVVLASSLDSTIWVLDLTNPGAGLTQITSISGTGYFGQFQSYVGNVYAGGVYIPANHSIAIGDPAFIGRQTYKLQIPTTVVGGATVYNPAGTWVWSNFSAPGAVGPDGVTGGNTFTRWNTVYNMGDGRQAIVVVCDPNVIYIYKVPAAGL